MSEPLYETDFYTWTQEQAEALRAKNLGALDLEHLAEEIADLGRLIEHTIDSHLERLLLHLLKLRHAPNPRPRRGWKVTVDHARTDIAKYIARNPGLQHLPARYLPDAYRVARRRAGLTMDRPPATFPEICPWSLEQLLDENFWPEAEGDSN